MEEGLDVADSRNGLASRDAHIWSLRMAVMGAGLIIIFLVYVIDQRQNKFTVQIPPDLSRGALVKPGEYIGATSYTFASHIWRELNTWPVNGRNDFKAKIEVNKCYLTPNFYQQMVKLYKKKFDDGELDRTRMMVSRIPFKDSMVRDLGAATYGIDLYMNLNEELDNYELKDINLHYPIRVVPDNRECNLFGQSLDGFYQETAIMSEEALEKL